MDQILYIKSHAEGHPLIYHSKLLLNRNQKYPPPPPTVLFFIFWSFSSLSSVVKDSHSISLTILPNRVKSCCNFILRKNTTYICTRSSTVIIYLLLCPWWRYHWSGRHCWCTSCLNNLFDPCKLENKKNNVLVISGLADIVDTQLVWTIFLTRTSWRIKITMF